MLNTILGTKERMEQGFTREGLRLAITVVKSGPNLITSLKNHDKDGYTAAQIGFGTKKIARIKKPILGHLKNALKISHGVGPRYLKEVGIDNTEGLELGGTIKPSDFLKPGDIVQVTGISKGKGFAGVVKRWGFAGGPKTHGQSDRHRAPGSIGQRQTPGRVFKGKKMAGHMGQDKVTVKNLVILQVTDNEIRISGPIPGSRGTLLTIKKTSESKKSFNLWNTSKDNAPEENLAPQPQRTPEQETPKPNPTSTKRKEMNHSVPRTQGIQQAESSF